MNVDLSLPIALAVGAGVIGYLASAPIVVGFLATVVVLLRRSG